MGSTALMERRPCPVCGSERDRSIFNLDQFQFYCDSADVPKRADLREAQCLDCLAIFLNPCYSRYGYEVLFAEAGCSYGSTEAHCRRQIEWMQSKNLLRPGSRLLDAGCFEGAFLARLPEHVTRIGVDIDEPAIQRGRRALAESGVELILGDFESFRLDQGVDVITMFHVLEHLPRPVQVLRH